MVEATSDNEVIRAVAAADATGEPVLLLGGGSNLVIADIGFQGTLVRIATHGISAKPTGERARLEAAAGEPLCDLAARCTHARRLGRYRSPRRNPGTTGATPVQNVGAYGQQVADAILSVRAYDRANKKVVELRGDECGFAYRSRIFRTSGRFVVFAVTFDLRRSRVACPVRHLELARLLAAELGARLALAEVHEAVLQLRYQKGMVIDPEDPDPATAGSFLVKPVMSVERFAELEHLCIERPGFTVCPRVATAEHRREDIRRPRG